jgi:predicted flavoprotein YhiN
MPGKKRTSPGKKRTSKEAPSWQVILEDIRSQNRAVMEAMDTRHEEIRQEVRHFRAEVHADLSVIRTLVSSHGIDLRDLKSGLARVETRVGEIAAKTDQVPALAERVAVLERRGT